MSLPDELTDSLDATAWQAIAGRLRLSPREVEIASFVVGDLKESAIAQRIGISTHTVHTHLERLYHKLSVNSRVELVVRVFHTYLQLVNEPGSTLPPLCGNRAASHCPLSSRRTSS
jgi:DNA-binding CsgD family transcriptional regulator